jgi:site-specific DNA-methyltransferase (adenine-specific)
MEIDKIYNMDCLEGMKQIPDGSIDAIICDLPYGTMKGIGKGGNTTWANINTEWDEIIPTEPLFEQYERVLRRNGVAVLFSQETYTSHLRTFKARNMEFLYPLIWEKSHAGNAMMSKVAPMNYFEDINVFRKKVQLVGDHPLRGYFRELLISLNIPKTSITKRLGTRAQHCFNTDGNQFSLCTEETYNALISEYHIDKIGCFKSFEECKRIDREFKDSYQDPDESVFNLPEGKPCKSNILKYASEFDGFHPTQKPVALIADLIRTYTNEGDTILDNCMGSGTTAVACIKEKRHFIGFELNKEYYDKACLRIDAVKRQLTIF